jgi:AcrR family transcriptional regulator
MATSMLIGMQQRPEVVQHDGLVRVCAEWFRCCLNLRVRLLQIEGKLYGKVLGRGPGDKTSITTTGHPSVVADQDSLRLATAVARAADNLTPAATAGREAFLRAAWEILGESGPDAVTVASLCERVRVTKGSFHHHFGTMTRFIEALAEFWEVAFNAIIDTYAAQPDPLHRLEGAFQAAFAMPWPASRAWLSWGWTNPVIAAAQNRALQRTEQVCAACCIELIGNPEKGGLVAKMAVGLSIGMQTRYPPTDLAEYAILGMEWARRCLGLDADLTHVDGMLQVRLARRTRTT